jgi:hypothetical protein
MRRYLPIVASVALILGIGYFVVSQKQGSIQKIEKKSKEPNIGTFSKQLSCARPPLFLKKIHIPQPVVIDLSQKVYKGIAFHYGKDFSKVLHPKIWEQYEHFSTYTVDVEGNIFLIPTPFISIKPTTFNLQKNIYKLDSKTGKLSIFMHFDDLLPSSQNPYGLNAVTYDCENRILWAAAIDKSNYQSEKGRIYAVDVKQKEVLSQIENVDALSMSMIKTNKGKFLLVGSARDNGLYAYKISAKKKKYKRIKILELPLANERIRKIKIKAANLLELQSVPFSYSLIAQSSKEERTFYTAKWDILKNRWVVNKK